MTKKYNIRQAKQMKDLREIKTLNCTVDWNTKSVIKDAKGNLYIEGFANTVDKDRVGDVVLPSAFEGTIKEFMENPVMLYQHDWDKIIGNFVEVKVVDDSEDTNGLWVKAKVSNAKDVEDVVTKIKEGSLKTFSIGYNELDSDYDKETNTNIVKELELLEISVVTIPCNPFSKFKPSEDDESKSDEYSATKVNKELLNFLSDAIKELKDVNEVSGDFLAEIIDIFNGTEE